ncbi:MAG: thioredoxin family protein [Fusicatenibacter sp.]
MALFGLGKKKEEEKKAPACCCGGSESKVEESTGCCCGTTDIAAESAGCCGDTGSGIINIKVLGAGCKSCHEQYENAKAAVKAMGLTVEVEYITDMEKVMGYGVMSMPAIVVNEKVVSMGKVLKAADVEKLLHKLGY